MLKNRITLLNEYMDSLAAHNYFNGAVLVGYKGEVLLKKGYGFSSFQYDIPNTPSTKFSIGSLTKAFLNQSGPTGANVYEHKWIWVWLVH